MHLQQLEKSEDLEKAYTLIGVCAHLCANIEYSMVFLLHPIKWNKYRANLEQKKQKMLDELVDVKKYNAASNELDKVLSDIDQEIDKMYTMTLGQLICEVKKNYRLADKQETYLREILEKRNYVIHKIWGAYGRRLKDPIVIKEMLKKLEDYEAFFRTASDWLWKQACSLNAVPDGLR